MTVWRRLHPGGTLFVPVLLGLVLASCGSTAGATGATAASTPTCPPTAAFKSLAGNITAIGSGTLTVTDAKGTATPVQLATSTRITRIAAATSADLAANTPVQVVTDTDATTAQRVTILSSGTSGGSFSGFGGFGGQRRATGTPSSSFNPACARRPSQDQGAIPGQGSGFQGLRGTVDSASSTKLVFDDVQGQTYSVAITPSTVIRKITSGQASDLQVGMTVLIVGPVSSGHLTARTITIQPAATT